VFLLDQEKKLKIGAHPCAKRERERMRVVVDDISSVADVSLEVPSHKEQKRANSYLWKIAAASRSAYLRDHFILHYVRTTHAL
jgi:transcriptional regulator of NAD metabolism